MVVSRMHYGRVETMLMNLMRNMDRDKVVFDFMVNYAEPAAPTTMKYGRWAAGFT